MSNSKPELKLEQFFSEVKLTDLGVEVLSPLRPACPPPVHKTVCLSAASRSIRSVKVAKKPKTLQKKPKVITKKPKVTKAAKPQVKKPNVRQSVAAETVPRMYWD